MLNYANKLFLFILSLLCTPANAQDFILGHNLTPTTAVLNAGDSMLGTYAAGYGLTDKLTIATSPWLDISYNMPNVGLKYALPSGSDHTSFVIESLYFKTYPYGEKLFEQESYFLRLTYGLEFFGVWNPYLSVGYQYFVNDKRAYSLRAIPQQDDPRTASVSLLQIFNVHGNLAFLIELGVLGLNYPVPFNHYGASMNVRVMNWMLQFGFSASRSREAIDYEIDGDSRMYWSGTSKGRTQHDIVRIIHPEIQVEYIF